ncbi:hypothetical protein [Desulfatibacillum aliphaticivorans]|uniref:hypothetical protein n=1 Tax=Desulfatibacillum aliphaticivorans TaxID=218208 RepID=UPI0002E80D18|nr:hypothetical protein [Desulfatibacillum aliphaticivorans]
MTESKDVIRLLCWVNLRKSIDSLHERSNREYIAGFVEYLRRRTTQPTALLVTA